MRAGLVERGYAAGWRLTRALPAAAAAAIFRAGADLAVRRDGPAPRRLRENLRRVTGDRLTPAELDGLLRAAMRSYARYWVEAFRLPSLSREQIVAAFHLGGADLLAADVAAGRGAVVALPHAGNWDAAGAWVAAQGWPIVTVAERLRPEGLYERFLTFRRGLGMEIIPQTGGDHAPMRVLGERLGQGHVVALLADRDLSARGVPVEFFGASTRMPAGPALLALTTGAPLYAARMWFTPQRPCGQLVGPLPLPPEGPLDERVRLLTQRLADEFAAGIAEHPADWHMLQPVWRGAAAAVGGGVR
ncbi:phosphatidylinositol mannoside acyltransferase [Pilimelia columellifera]|uniref:phosphatidylinositol mannoside acyltransferase n=1 Tax=Pilimelia columellifera TaxID=706574 RepID=UPI0031CDEE55